APPRSFGFLVEQQRDHLVDRLARDQPPGADLHGPEATRADQVVHRWATDVEQPGGILHPDQPRRFVDRGGQGVASFLLTVRYLRISPMWLAGRVLVRMTTPVP